MIRNELAWLGLAPDRLPVEEIRRWAVRPDCGAVVVFCGTTRDHSEGRSGVSELVYEAYEAQAERRLVALEAEARAAWPQIRAVAAVHRTGSVELGEEAVVVAVSSAHRAEAFAAASHLIDRLKASVPIWKEEVSDTGRRWSPEALEIDQQ
ncbi:MAG: molybdenum cofactor biosynthesis protein MoaE [Microthrixaceae bacterium]